MLTIKKALVASTALCAATVPSVRATFEKARLRMRFRARCVKMSFFNAADLGGPVSLLLAGF